MRSSSFEKVTTRFESALGTGNVYFKISATLLPVYMYRSGMKKAAVGCQLMTIEPHDRLLSGSNDGPYVPSSSLPYLPTYLPSCDSNPSKIKCGYASETVARSSISCLMTTLERVK